MCFKHLARGFAIASSLWMAVSSVTAANQVISVNLQGRSSAAGNPGTTPLGPSDQAGVVLAGNWNNIDDHYNAAGTIPTFNGANDGTTAPLVDSTGAATPVTLTFYGNDSWYNDVDITTLTSPNALMMNGILKVNAGGRNGPVSNFTFNNVPDGAYDAYVYINMNGDGVVTDLYDDFGVGYFHVTEKHQFTDTSTFVEAKNTDPNGTPDTGNYVHFTGLSPFGTGKINLNARWVSGADGNGVAGIQLVKTSTTVPPLPAPKVLTQPASDRYVVGSTPTLKATALGAMLHAQWYKNNAIIAGATNLSYTLPALTDADSGTSYYVTISNSAGSVSTSNSIVTVGHLVAAPGYSQVEHWDNLLRADVEAPGFNTPVTQPIFYAQGIATPVNRGINNFTERVSGLLTPKVTGDYVFIVCSDDDSDLFLSTDSTPAHKVLLANESVWSNPLQWNSSGGGSVVPDKESDTSSVGPGRATRLVAGTSYYIEGVHHQGGGGENFNATMRLASDPNPVDGTPSVIIGSLISTMALDGSTVTITQQPSDVTLLQDRTAYFTVAATGSTVGSSKIPPVTYQWQKKGPSDSAFADIPGETGTTLGIPLALQDNGTKFQAVVSTIGSSVTSAVATATVQKDIYPALASVGPIYHGGVLQLGIAYSKTVLASTVPAASSITLTGGTITSATSITNDNGIVLTVSGIAPGAAGIVHVPGGATDKYGNISVATNINFTAPPTNSVHWASIGNPVLPAAVVPVGTNGFDVISGGVGFWANYDEVTFVYVAKTNDFNMQVQVVEQDFASKWARGGLQVRETTDEGKTSDDVTGGYLFSAYREVHANANQVDTNGINGGVQGQGASNNAFEANRRVGMNYGAADNNTSGWGTGSYLGTAPTYPNVWLRLQRTGTNIFGYRSTDGANWLLIAQDVWPNAPAVLLVGPGYSPENGNSWGASNTSQFKDYLIQYRNFGDVPPQSSTIGISYDGSKVKLIYTGTLQSAPVVTGPYTDVPGAVSPYSVSPSVNSFYRSR